ncbi:hypothetical protein P3U41_05620 [Mammaliicoccus sciuri]|uniref:hypothetical protein n=1 Tax=Mammaliicoccus sciuri TaxID=1296 RepID=UPI002B262D26|nr:hypothetical protein [Mammaliicoccus sciuri]WQL34247.1 hypothetical protein P3U41_05620 [Mammaliicoccus sciuri]WQL61186.1 hypothetical protein P3T96_05620 [Mammaliicoccus sciuri]
MELLTVVLRENVKPHSEVDRMFCNDLDKELFDTLTDDEKASYKASFEPNNDKGQYDFVATYKTKKFKN